MDLKKDAGKFLSNKYNLAFVAVILIGLYLRLKFIFVDSIWPDEALYQWYGYKILHMPFYFFSKEFAEVVAYFPSIFIAFFNIFTNSFVAGRITILLFGLAGIVLIYFLGKELKNSTIGLIAAILLTVNHLHWFIGSRTLLDVPLTTMFTLVGFFLIKYEKTGLKKWLMLLAVSIATTIYTKNAGYFIIPFVGLYFILRYKFKILKFIRKKEVLLAFGLFVLLMLPFLIINLSHFGRVTHVTAGSLVSTGGTTVSKLLPSYNVLFMLTGQQELNLLGIIFILAVILFLIFMFLYMTREYLLLFAWLMAIWGSYTFLHPSSVPRYFLPVLPALYLLTGIIIFEIGKYVKQFSKIKISNWILIVLAILIAIPSYGAGNNLNLSKSYSYTGFKEAGEWLRDNIEDNAIVYSASVRSLRAFSGLEEFESGGNLAGYPDKEDFEEIVRRGEVPIYIEIDLWERIQPEFVYPLTEATSEYLQSLGFIVVKVVEGNYVIGNQAAKGPVIFILKKG